MKMNYFIDSDIFIIDFRYKKDKKYSQNLRFLHSFPENEISGFTSIFNLLEVCGVLSLFPGMLPILGKNCIWM